MNGMEEDFGDILGGYLISLTNVMTNDSQEYDKKRKCSMVEAQISM